MSPVLPQTTPRFAMRRCLARRPATQLLPFCPAEPKPEAGALAQGKAGGSMESPKSPTVDCPPPEFRTFPEPLVGIARLAADAPAADTKRRSLEKPEYFLLPVKSILNRCDSERVPFDWTINPYRGCEFACKYCYARYTHEYMELDGGEFERKIFVKQDVAAVLARDLERKYSHASKASGYTKAEHIAIGTATDPYQPAEKEYGVTRACLEELGEAGRAEHFDYYEIEPDCAGPGYLEGDCGEVCADSEHYCDNAEAAAGKTAGAAGAAAGFAIGGGEGIASGGIACGRFGFAAASGNYGCGWRVGGRCRGSEGSGRRVVLVWRAVSDARLRAAVFAAGGGEISEAGEAIPGVVREKMAMRRKRTGNKCRIGWRAFVRSLDLSAGLGKVSGPALYRPSCLWRGTRRR